MGVGDHNGSPQQMIFPTITNFELRIMNYKLSIIMLKNIYPH